MYEVGSIIQVDLGKPPDAIKGHEQAFIRPCVVIKDYTHLGLVTIIPFTSVPTKYAMFSVVPVPSATTILSKDSYALCHQLRSISHKRIKKFEGTISNAEFNRIRGVLFTLLF